MESLTRAEIIVILTEQNPGKADQVAQYADAYAEYVEASANIAANGLVVQHPRTMNPIVNPYGAIRDRALKKLQSFRRLATNGLWD